MTLAALSKNLRESLKQGLRFHLVSDGNVTSGLANELLKQAQPRLETFGPYTLLHSPQVPDLWQALVHESAGNNTLVILPPASTAETEILLQQLPNTAPPGAAVALFTSGTSGEAKAVFHSVRSLLASALQLARALPGKNPSCSLLPAWGMAGFAFHCLLPGLRGGSHLFSSQPFFQWSGRAGEIFQTLDLDFVSLNPFLLEMFCRGGIPPGWKGKIISLTAPLKDQLKSELKQRWNREAEEIYGMTEAAGPVLFEGKSLGAEIRLGQDQELELRGEQLFLGYGIEGSFEPQRDWFRSGDIFEEKEGKFLHVGRNRDLIDSGGRKVPPRMIEEVMERMPEIAESLAFPITLAGLERPGLIYKRNPACSLSEDELRRKVENFIATQFSGELRPKWWLEVMEIPRGSTGKPDRKAARARWGFP